VTNQEQANFILVAYFGSWVAIALTCLVIARWWHNRKAKKVLLAGLTSVGNGSMITYMDSKQKDVHHLFHILWTKAVGTETYNKNEWKQLSAYLYSMMAAPGSSSRIAEAERVIQPPTRFERDPVL
jgi:hypothetical protein